MIKVVSDRNYIVQTKDATGEVKVLKIIDGAIKIRWIKQSRDEWYWTSDLEEGKKGEPAKLTVVQRVI